MGRSNKYDTDELLRKFFEGGSSAEEEDALRGTAADGCGVAAEEKAAAVMFEFFRQEREVRYPGNIAPLRRSRRFGILLRSAAAAAATVTVAMTAILWRPQVPEVYCFVNGQAVTDYEAAVEQSGIAIGILSESLEMTAAMFRPLDDVERMVRELEGTGIFDMLSAPVDTENNNS